MSSAENKNMKFYVFVFSALLTIVFFNVSCSKKVPVELEEPEMHETFIDGIILSKKADLCLFGRDSEMHPVIKLSAGDGISVLEIEGAIDKKIISHSNSSESESVIISGDSENSTDKTPEGTVYFHVIYDNMDFWMEKAVLAFNCDNAVTIEKTFLYSDSELTQKIDTQQNPLKFATLIAKATEEKSDTNSKATRIFYYDSSEKAVHEAFVLSSSISSRIDDIVVSQVVESLKTTTRAVPRNELFAKAAKYSPCPKVQAALNDQKVERQTNSYKEVLKSMQRMSFGVNVEELLTVDQSKDPFQKR